MKNGNGLHSRHKRLKYVAVVACASVRMCVSMIDSKSDGN